MKPPNAAFPGKNGKIAFDTSRDGNLEIYAMSNVGIGEENLTSSSAGDRAPSYSPSGKSIAFVSSRDGNAEIYRMSSTGIWKPASPTIRFPTPSPPGNRYIRREYALVRTLLVSTRRGSFGSLPLLVHPSA
jgi:Tol biopolymer transport system component